MATRNVTSALKGQSRNEGGYPPASSANESEAETATTAPAVAPSLSGEPTDATIDWDTELPNGGDVAISFMQRCTWDINVCCAMLIECSEDIRKSDDEDVLQMNIRIRTLAVRIKELDSLLMSYFTNDAISLSTAHMVLYGEYGTGEVTA